MMYKILKCMVLLVGVAQAGIVVSSYLGEKNISADEFSSISVDIILHSEPKDAGSNYNREFFEELLKKRLVEKSAQTITKYHYGFWKISSGLPLKLEDGKNIKVQWMEEPKQCVVKKANKAGMKQVYFPKIKLKFIVSCYDTLTEGTYDLSKLSDHNVKILSFNKSDKGEEDSTVGRKKVSNFISLEEATDLSLNEQSLKFFDQIRGMFSQNPDFGPLQLNKAIELANICPDYQLGARVSNNDVEIIRTYMWSVLLI